VVWIPVIEGAPAGHKVATQLNARVSSHGGLAYAKQGP
jgi:hypothetical protein